jgi:hypothetical protein
MKDECRITHYSDLKPSEPEGWLNTKVGFTRSEKMNKEDVDEMFETLSLELLVVPTETGTASEILYSHDKLSDFLFNHGVERRFGKRS